MAKEAKEKDSKPEEEEKKEGAAEGEEKAEGEEGAAPEGKKKISTKLLVMAIVGGVIVLGGAIGAGLYFGGAFREKAPASEGAAAGNAAEGGKEGEKEKGKKEGKITFFQLGDLLVNLSGEGKRPNYLKMKISLELADEKDTALLETLKPRIIDNFQIYLRELRVEDLRGSAGMYRLREALLLRVTEAAAPVRIRDVLFQEILVQ